MDARVDAMTKRNVIGDFVQLAINRELTRVATGVRNQ